MTSVGNSIFSNNQFCCDLVRNTPQKFAKIPKRIVWKMHLLWNISQFWVSMLNFGGTIPKSQMLGCKTPFPPPKKTKETTAFPWSFENPPKNGHMPILLEAWPWMAIQSPGGNFWMDFQEIPTNNLQEILKKTFPYTPENEHGTQQLVVCRCFSLEPRNIFRFHVSFRGCKFLPFFLQFLLAERRCASVKRSGVGPASGASAQGWFNV